MPELNHSAKISSGPNNQKSSQVIGNSVVYISPVSQLWYGSAPAQPRSIIIARLSASVLTLGRVGHRRHIISAAVDCLGIVHSQNCKHDGAHENIC